VTHALVRARSKGFRLPPKLLPGALGYLRSIRNRFSQHHPEWVRREIESYALYVRALDGDRAPADARRIIQQAGGVEKLSLDSLGWLLTVVSGDAGSQAEIDAIRRQIDNRVTETAGKAQFVTSYQDGAHLTLSSNRRSDGILLEATIGDRPESDLIPKLVAGLLAHRKRGRWLNTQENVFILLALDRYFQKYEQGTPDFVARAWLGDAFALEHRFRGRSVDRQHVDVPLSYLAGRQQPLDLVISKHGSGRLYYRVGMQYAPKDLRPPPAEHGFSVTRSYEAVDAPDDVRRNRDGSWRIRAGALVRIRITMVAPARRYHVALVDPLPAGLEPLNPALATTQSIPQDPKRADPKQPWWWSRAWYEHQNLRDERAEAFASLLWAGVYDYTYVARATTPGEFVAPPPKAEEMYDPETFGRGSGDRVIVQ
jgi:alpha-2-macroglobulin